ncbi:HD domain-containing protein [Methanobrevibacter curvatus]|uniref:Deoxyguanosinetriphosphate triphosphohydrolase-like protein n=1 Tax=Methanobrevibacter curvatus TaxID=49547 RepID=A0A162FGJ8_9EURY|nr:HD domain-containing protein [Methanobrevibacter curvatus]KZX12735.1 deoxyguanosinetriphosphate triphosphohydrolase-like protein [Methanobrevibacter curvatus]
MDNEKKFIRDSVHGNLQLNDLEIRILDSPEMQRIRRIKQLGLISLIYPGANHTRLEHSLGTTILGSKLAKHLELDKDDQELVRLAGLLHDIGHGPFSHASESVLKCQHEELTGKVIKTSQLNDIISENYNVNNIIDMINGRGRLGHLVSGELDVDRMDYLIRDSHYTGVAYGVIDVERIITNMKLEKTLLLNIKGIQAAEAALVARYYMYPSVYQHHTTQILNAMFRRALKLADLEGILDLKFAYTYDDTDIVSIFRNSTGYAKEIMKRLDNRNLLKRYKSTSISHYTHPQDIFKITKKELEKGEEEISEKYDLDKDYVFLNIAEYPEFNEMKTQVYDNEEIFLLSDLSTVVNGLKQAEFNYPEISLFIPEEYKHKIDRFKFEDYLTLPEIDKSKFNKSHTTQSILF